MVTKWILGMLFFCGGGFLCCSAYAKNVPTEKSSSEYVCYIQFDFGTYMPVTRENISKYSRCFKLASSGNAAMALRGLLNDAKHQSKVSKTFDNYNVRLMVSSTNEEKTYFVDQQGIVLHNGKSAELARWQKAAVQIILNYSYLKSKGLLNSIE